MKIFITALSVRVQNDEERCTYCVVTNVNCEIESLIDPLRQCDANVGIFVVTKRVISTRLRILKARYRNLHSLRTMRRKNCIGHRVRRYSALNEYKNRKRERIKEET